MSILCLKQNLAVIDLFEFNLNMNLNCGICKGFPYKSCTTVECGHSFCRQCIVKHISNKLLNCPVCDLILHPTDPLINIQSDPILQSLLNKLYPQFFENEKIRKKIFYKSIENFQLHGLPIVLSYMGTSKGVKIDTKFKEMYIYAPAIVKFQQISDMIFKELEIPVEYQIGLFYKEHQIHESVNIKDFSIRFQIYFHKLQPVKLQYAILPSVIFFQNRLSLDTIVEDYLKTCD